MNDKLVTNIRPLGFTWQTQDPFLFCVHHQDSYPAGTEEMGPDPATFKDRLIGQDFIPRDGWRMYHGETVPGFPEHPHRGFETVTVVLEGFVDHSDSHGAAGRYGEGDVQWMTAGSGLQHAEMFPLLHQDRPNPLELFQIWLNLPGKNKFVEPHYKMLWAEDIPTWREKDLNDREIAVTIIAGQLQDVKALTPAPDSWAEDADNEVAIWLIRLDADATWELPSSSAGINRSLYFYKGDSIRLAGLDLDPYHSADITAEQPVTLENGQEPAFLLLLQGKPINEPVEQHGPFVMNSKEEINQAISDYQTTSFGGWPWPRPDHIHPRESGRFALYADGRLEEK